MLSKVKIAITGSIGSGKTTVCRFIQNAGYPVISADEVNGQLLKQQDIQKDICDLLNLEKFSKEAVAYSIFQSNEAKEALEAYLHPLILAQIDKFIADNNGLIFAEIPLLYEVGWNKHFDYTIAILTDNSIAEQRLVEYRNISKAETRRRRLQQIANEEKARKADFTIVNNGDLNSLQLQVEKVVSNLVSKIS